MIDKTKKRSFFVRIAFVLFAVALAFCSVSVALNDGKYKVEAYYTEPDSFRTVFVSDFFSVTVSDKLYFGSFQLMRSSNSTYPYMLVNTFGGSGQSIVDGSFTQKSPDNLAIFTITSPYIHVYQGSAYVSDFGNFVSRSASFGGTVVITYTFDNTSFILSFANTEGYTSISQLDPSVSDEPVINAVTDVWSSIFTWLTTSVNSLLGIFYINGELTILGVLVVMSLGISIFFLLLAVVSNFFHLRS